MRIQMNFKKIVSVILISSVVFGMTLAFSACKKNNKPREGNYIIQEDDPWYTGRSFNPSDYTNSKGASYNLEDSIFSVGNDLLVASSGFTYDEGGLMKDNEMFMLFDSYGDPLIENTMCVGNEYSSARYICAFREDDNIDIYFSMEDYDLIKDVIYKVTWDVNSNSLSEPVEEYGDFKENSYFYSSYSSDNYFAVVETGYDDMIQRLFVYNREDNVGVIDLSEMDMGNSWLRGIREEDGILVLNCMRYVSDITDTYSTEIIFDVQTGTVTDVKEAGPSYSKQSVRGFDGRLYSAKNDGIYVEDELYISYADCDYNLSSFMDVTVLSVEEDRVVLSGYEVDQYNVSFGKEVIFLEKQKRNPNAGKMVINALSPSLLSYGLTEGIIRFNRGDSKYFIRPEIMNIRDINMDSETEIKEYYKEFTEAIRSDNGPDIVFNASELSGVLTDEMFLDLSEDIDLDEEKYYTNIYDLTASGDKHFVIPLEYGISGLLIEGKNIDQGKKGFTFEEYSKFVSEVCDNTDPLSLNTSRVYYFLSMFDAMGDYWIKDKTVDFGSDSFNALLQYVKDVPEDVFANNISYYGDHYSVGSPTNKIALICKYVECIGASAYATAASKYLEPVLCGLPSLDGTGPVAYLESSASVTSNTGVKEGCIDFIRTLLSTEIQLNCEGFCMNKEAQGMLMSDKYKSELSEFSGNIAKFQAEAHENGYYEPDAKKMECVEDAIESVSCVTHYNYVVLVVVNNYVTGYLLGYNDDEGIVDSINNKVQSLIG